MKSAVAFSYNNIGGVGVVALDLSVVVSVYNEEGNLPTLVARVLRTLDSIGSSSELVLMHDCGCMLRGYSRQIVERLLSDPAHARFIPVRAMVFAEHPVEIEVAHAERMSGESKYGLLKLVRVFSNLVITVFFRGSSGKPVARRSTFLPRRCKFSCRPRF